MAVARRQRSSGFTLLEVLVAIAILGLGLTVILSSQVGLFSSAQRAQKLSLATGLARCHMNEVELDLMDKGFPLLEQNNEGPCCEDDRDPDFECSSKIETVELPPPPDLSDTADGGLPNSSSSPSPGGLGPLAGNPLSGGALGGGLPGAPEGAADNPLFALLGGGAGGGLAAMAMSMVYPEIKPMLEASIRKVTVTVTWHEGKRERQLSVTQYLTRPQQGGLYQQGLIQEALQQ